MKQVPLLFLGDAPDTNSGLGRIGRHLASRISSLPEFRVGYLGRGSVGHTKLPFQLYCYPEAAQWGEDFIMYAWENFAGDEDGIIFTVWDPSRLHWFANPNGLPKQMKQFLLSGRFRKWGYFAVDSTGPGDRLTAMCADTLKRYDRVLAYGAWGAGVIARTVGLGEDQVDWIPHGIDMKHFKPRDRMSSRMSIGATDKDIIVGCLMSNQARKDWGLAFQVVRLLANKYRNLKFWFHTDLLERSWLIPALIEDYGLGDRVLGTVGPGKTDDELSYCYSACDVTMLPSLGEGFGYPIVESLACGVPCVTGKYGGGVELVTQFGDGLLVEPTGWRLDTPWNCLRPVYNPVDWAEKLQAIIDAELPLYSSDVLRESIEFLDWKNLWPVWEKWVLKGIGVER